MNAAVIICAAGSSTRFGGAKKKIFENVCGKPVFLRSINVFSEIEDVKQIILAISPEDEEKILINWEANLGFIGVELCHGGACRGETVKNALAKVRNDIDIVAVHDGARCCVKKEWVLEALSVCEQSGAAALASPVVSTLKRVENGCIAATIDRENLFEAQTPQVFSRKLIVEAYERLDERQLKSITDDCSAVQAAGGTIIVVKTDNSNIKITTKADIALAEAIIKSRKNDSPKSFHPFMDEKW
jgi:2-C-methyl-D-erythritol 4-phosphate cytidylyltransferase